MFKQLTAILLLVYFSLGTLCLPRGNFDGISDLPAMYHHCKALEDKDMTPFDFITDHLVNIDGIFDSHDHGDEQRPHTPFTFHNLAQQSICLLTQTSLIPSDQSVKTAVKSGYSEPLYPSDYVSRIFRPPSV